MKASNDFRIFSELLRSVGMGNAADVQTIASGLPGTKALVRLYTDKKGYVRAGNFYALGAQPLAVRTPRASATLNGTGGHKATATPSGTPTPKAGPAGQSFGRLVE